MKTLAAYCIIIILLSSALYLGIGGMGKIEFRDSLKEWSVKKPDISDTAKVNYNGLSFDNSIEMNKSDIAEEYIMFIKIFFWAEHIPDVVCLLITCCAFSLLGSIIWLLRDCLVSKTELCNQKYLLHCLLGFLTGFFVLGLTYVLPTVLLKGDSQFRPISLMFFSLFAGMYSFSFYNKLSTLFEKKIFSENEK